MIKRTIHRLALNVEGFADRLFHRTASGRVIDAYIGYTTPEHVVLRGRVLSKLRHATAVAGQSRLANMRQMIGMFLTEDVRGVAVKCNDIETVTDEEGYFTILLPADSRTGWSTEQLLVEGSNAVTHCRVMAPRADAKFMVISDIDDTMLETGAYSLPRNLYTSFTGHAGSRIVFKDAVELMKRLNDDGRNPVYYVSSSPWNLHDFLMNIFERTALIVGPMFLRDLGLSETKFITEGHGNHKGESIDQILAANPNLPAILLGDTGQHDTSIYTDVIRRHEKRVIAVGLRTPGSGLDEADRMDLAALAETGVPYFAATDFKNFIKRLTDENPDALACLKRSTDAAR